MSHRGGYGSTIPKSHRFFNAIRYLLSPRRSSHLRQKARVPKFSLITFSKCFALGSLKKRGEHVWEGRAITSKHFLQKHNTLIKKRVRFQGILRVPSHGISIYTYQVFHSQKKVHFPPAKRYPSKQTWILPNNLAIHYKQGKVNVNISAPNYTSKTKCSDRNYSLKQ